jgi:hypothetical protein
MLSGVLLAFGTSAQTTPPEGKDKPAAATAKDAGGKSEKGGKPPLAIPPDAAREQAIVDAVTARVPAAEVLQLEVEKSKVLALYREQTGREPRGAVLLLHAMDDTADEPGLIHALRTGLPAAGWSTLSLQLPVLPAGSPREAYGGTQELAQKRIAAALARLAEKKPEAIAIVGQELGAALALSAAANAKEVKGVVALSLSSAEGLNPPAVTVPAMETLKLPVLDVSGEFADSAQRGLVDQRANAARAAQHIGYSQTTVPGVDDMLGGATDIVVARVRAWLTRHATIDAAAETRPPDAAAPTPPPTTGAPP